MSVVVVKPHIYIFCLELDNGRIHRSEEFMDIWRLIEFYKSWGVRFNFFVEDYEK